MPFGAPQSRPRILVIRGGAIGDFILTLPAIRLLREAFPEAHLEILGYQHIIELAHGRFYADAIRSIEYGPLSAFFARNGNLADGLVEYFAGFQQIVSYLFDPDRIFEQNIRRCGVKHFLAISPKLDDSAHASEQLAIPLQQLALYLDDRAARVHPSDSDRAFADRTLAGVTTPLIAIHPGSGGERKNWPLTNWEALGDWLLSLENGFSIILAGGEADEDRLQCLAARWPSERVIRAFHFPLPHLAALLSRCRLFIGHDSGISHLAAASGGPCVLLFGPTDPDVWAPRNHGVHVIAAPGSRMEHLETVAVQEAVRNILR